MGTIFVRVAGERVMLSIGKIQREFLLQQAPNQEAPHVVARNMKWETLPAVLLQLPLHLNPADVVVDAWGAGKNIRVDGAAGEFDTVRLQHLRQDLVTKYVQFMASCPCLLYTSRCVYETGPAVLAMTRCLARRAMTR